MGKIKVRELSKKELDALVKELRGALKTLRNTKDLEDILLKLLTPSEVVMTARRIQIAKRLAQGKTFDEIRSELGVGFPTIHHVGLFLRQHGKAMGPITGEMKRK
jgi:uncharacterized protein YerC